MSLTKISKTFIHPKGYNSKRSPDTSDIELECFLEDDNTRVIGKCKERKLFEVFGQEANRILSLRDCINSHLKEYDKDISKKYVICSTYIGGIEGARNS